ncbi:MAG: hypothetical protein KA436_12345 [Oligoflexales bacterium]|nr:hypothetical protein [Oligoflexales bacterium]
MKQLLLLLLFLSFPSFADNCHQHYERHQAWKMKAEEASKPAAVAMGAASFFGPIATYVVMSVGAGAIAAMDQEAEKHKRRYDDCLRNREEEVRAVALANAKKAREEREKREEEERQAKDGMEGEKV